MKSCLMRGVKLSCLRPTCLASLATWFGAGLQSRTSQDRIPHGTVSVILSGSIWDIFKETRYNVMFKKLNLITIDFISVSNKLIVDAKDDIKLRTGVVDIHKTKAL